MLVFGRGSSLLSRLANYHPSRFSKYAWLDVGYRPPAGPFDLDAINKMTEQNLGYPIFGYWHFFNDEDAEDMMNNHVGHSADDKIFKFSHQAKA